MSIVMGMPATRITQGDLPRLGCAGVRDCASTERSRAPPPPGGIQGGASRGGGHPRWRLPPRTTAVPAAAWIRQLRAQPVLSSSSMTPAPTDLDPPCPPAPAGEAGATETPRASPGGPGPAAPPRRPPAVRRDRAGGVGRPRRGLARGRPRSPAGASTAPGGTRTARTPTSRRWSSWIPRRADPERARRHRPAHAPPRGGAGRRDPADPPARRAAPAPDRGGADGEGGLLRGQLPRRLRDDPCPPGRPAGRGRGRCRRARDARGRPRPRPPRPLGRRRPAAPPLRRPGRRRAGRGVRGADRRGLDGRPRARGGLPRRHLRRRGSTSRPTSGRSTRRSATRSRRKLRRAEAAGEVRLERSTDPVADLDAFVDLHQKRWGAEGLFPPTAGGDQSRAFFRRLFELLADDGTVQLHFLAVGGRRIAAGVWFEDADGLVPLQRRRRPRGARALARASS